jgi:uncharacterized protein (TIGR02246 family)
VTIDPDTLARIEELRRADVAASLRWDAAALSALLTEDVVLLPPGGEPVRGRAAARAGLEAAGATAPEVLEYREEFEETLVLGDHAVEWGWISGAERPREGGEIRRSRHHVMRILRREPDGAWKVARSIFCDAPVGR